MKTTMTAVRRSADNQRQAIAFSESFPSLSLQS